MTFAVCDNDNNDIEALRTALAEVCPEAELRCFTDTTVFTEFVKESSALLTAVVIDIEIGDENGIELGAGISELCPGLPIIFYTAYASRYTQSIFLESAYLKPFGVISKPLEKDVVSIIIKQLGELSDKKKDSGENCVFKCGGDVVSLPSDSITYIESKAHAAIIHSDRGDFKLYMKLSDVNKMLPDNFTSCHKSYIVNMMRIKSFSAASCTLDSGTKLPVSRARRDDFKSSVFHYIGR